MGDTTIDTEDDCLAPQDAASATDPAEATAPPPAGVPTGDGDTQLLLFPPAEALDEEALRRYLERGVGARVTLTLTRNRTSVLTFKRGSDGGYDVRLQRVFLDAPDDILNAVVCFVRRPTRPVRELVIAYFSSHPEAERRARRPAVPPPEARPRGAAYDLADLMAGLNARYFDGAVRSTISWGESSCAMASGHGRGGGGGRTIRFGSYVGEHDLIRIDPALDAAWVPRFFVESIVFHEMLHAVIPISRDEAGRRVIHPPEFKARERRFHEHDAALAWERENLRRLLSMRG